MWDCGGTAADWVQKGILVGDTHLPGMAAPALSRLPAAAPPLQTVGKLLLYKKRHDPEQIFATLA